MSFQLSKDPAEHPAKTRLREFAMMLCSDMMPENLLSSHSGKFEKFDQPYPCPRNLPFISWRRSLRDKSPK